MRSIFFGTALLIFISGIITTIYGCSHYRQDEENKSIVDTKHIFTDSNTAKKPTIAVNNIEEPDFIDSLSIPNNRPLTFAEWQQLPYKERIRYKYSTTIDIYQCTITDNNIKSAIVKYIENLDPKKNNTPLTVGIDYDWLSMYHGLVNLFDYMDIRRGSEMLCYTILNGRTVYIFYSLNIFDIPWIKINKGITKKHKINITYILNYSLFFGDGVAENPIYFFDKNCERAYYQALESEQNEANVVRHKEAVVTTFDRDSAAVSAKNDTINTVIYNDSVQ